MAQMKVLVRLPNWLGDMVMSVAFINQLPHFFPQCEVSVIAKKGIHSLLPLFPKLDQQFIFDKEEYKGLAGAWRFGKEIKRDNAFDVFFCLPDSFSSAVMGYATGAKKRVGYRKELRSFFLTKTYHRRRQMHRVEEYISLLELYANKKALPATVSLTHTHSKKEHIVVNINSEASSRRLPVPKAVQIINALRKEIGDPIVLIGSPVDKALVDEVFQKLNSKDGIKNVSGQTTLLQLTELLASAKLMLTTDSGPAHLANALQTKTIALFGAGNEAVTAPYNQPYRTIIRLGELSCEPCEKNFCYRYGTPQCLEQLSTSFIIQSAVQQLQTAS